MAADDIQKGQIIPDVHAHAADRLSPNMDATVATVPNSPTTNNLTAEPTPKPKKHTTAYITPATGIRWLQYLTNTYPTANHDDTLLDNIDIVANQVQTVVHPCDLIIHNSNDELHRSIITNTTDVDDGSMDSNIYQIVPGIDTPHIMGSADVQTYQTNVNTVKDEDTVTITTYENDLGTAADASLDLTTHTHE